MKLCSLPLKALTTSGGPWLQPTSHTHQLQNWKLHEVGFSIFPKYLKRVLITPFSLPVSASTVKGELPDGGYGGGCFRPNG